MVRVVKRLKRSGHWFKTEQEVVSELEGICWGSSQLGYCLFRSMENQFCIQSCFRVPAGKASSRKVYLGLKEVLQKVSASVFHKHKLSEFSHKKYKSALNWFWKRSLIESLLFWYPGHNGRRQKGKCSRNHSIIWIASFPLKSVIYFIYLVSA